MAEKNKFHDKSKRNKKTKVETSLEEDINKYLKEEKHKLLQHPFDFDELRGLK